MRLAFSLLLACFAVQMFAADPMDLARIPPLGWVRDNTIGVTGGIPERTNVTVIYANAAPYNADKTGATDTGSALMSAIAAASSNNVVLLSNGVYKSSVVINLTKSGVTVRSESYGGVTIVNTTSSGVVRIGAVSEVSPVERINISSGATRGSSNIVLAASTQAVVGDIIEVAQRNPTNDLFQVISTSGYQNLFTETVRVKAKVGLVLTIWPPLCNTFTNAPSISLLSNAGAHPDFAPVQYSGFEGINFSMTNEVDNTFGTATFLADLIVATDCWYKNCKFISAENYNIRSQKTVNTYIGGATVEGRQGPAQSNHGGIVTAQSGAQHIDNSFFHKSLFPGIEFNNGWTCSAVSYCLFTNVHLDVLAHNVHPMFNLFEGNRGFCYEQDGYFGSASHTTLFRNWFASWFVSIYLKRFNTYCQLIGNVLGTNNAVYEAFSTTASGAGATVVQIGYPNIGNHGYDRATGSALKWHWPGTNWGNGSGVNGWTTISNQTSTTNVAGNFASLTSTLYALFIQSTANTNHYHGSDDDVGGALAVIPYQNGTTTNLITVAQYAQYPQASPVSVAAGDIIYLGGSGSFQHFQSSNALTHLIHGNYDYFNEGIVYASGYDTTLPDSLIWSSTPSWWLRTNTINSSFKVTRFPAYQPTVVPNWDLIPVEIWAFDGTNPFTGEAGEEPEPPEPPSAVKGLNVTGRTTISGKVILGTQ